MMGYVKIAIRTASRVEEYKATTMDAAGVEVVAAEVVVAIVMRGTLMACPSKQCYLLVRSFRLSVLQ